MTDISRRKQFQWYVGLVSLATLATLGILALGADQPGQPVATATAVGPPAARPAAAVPVTPGPKMVIERPTKEVLKARSAPAAAVPAPRPDMDRPKRAAIERPTERVVRDLSAPAAAAGFVNPKVEPGKVRWHPNFAAACAFSAKSGKPVLL